MNGFDISNHQAGLDLTRIADPWDFAIMKATGGTGFVDPCCDPWVQQCKALGKKRGFYHFGDDGYGWNPSKEAAFFNQLGRTPKTDGLVAMWQYCSDGKVAGVESTYLDLDRFYGDSAAWDAYARGGRATDAAPPTTSGGASVLENDYRVTIERK